MQSLRVLVVGCHGQVGHEVVARAAAFPALAVQGAARPECDLVQPVSVADTLARHQPGLVINATAYTAVDRAESERDAAFAVNRDGVALLAELCARRRIPLLHLSTDYVFDGSGTQPWKPDDRPQPLGVYGASKLAGEQALRDRLPEHLTLRTSWVFGAHGNNFVRTMIRLAGERDRLRVVADQTGGPTWSGHIADALLALADRYRQAGNLPWGTYHYAGQPWTTWYALAGEAIAAAHRHGLVARLPVIEPIASSEYPTPAQRPLNSRLDMQDTTRALGLASPDWRAGLEQVLQAWARPA
ncbi:MAG: dTDP-4-dehydrorhamnose reductase [Pseudomonadota bacterium]